MVPFTELEFNTRITALQRILNENNIDIAVFNQPAELYYYSGSVMPLYCIIPKEDGAFLLARKGAPRIKEECTHLPLETFSTTGDLTAILKKRSITGIKKAGFVLDSMSYSSAARMLALFKTPAPIDISWDVKMLRTVKSDAEIKIHRQAGKIISSIPGIVKKNYRAGITELEMSAHIEFYLRMNRGGSLKCRQEGLVLAPGVFSAGINSLTPNKFDGICSGKGLSAALPFGGNNESIPINTAVICDYGLSYEGYHVDITRMFSIGDPPEKAIKAMEAMLTVQSEVINALKPGVSWESVWQIAEQTAYELGYSEQFMGIGSEKVKFVGHGLGLYLDEPPFLAPKMPDIIMQNMVIAVEPKVALPDIGVVGIEDSILITNRNAVGLTDCPKEFYIL